MNSIYNLAEQFVINSFNKVNKQSQLKHFLRTVYWLKELRSDADEALLVSAVAHDIERAFRQQDMIEKKNNLGFTDIEFYRPHEERGAEIIADFLRQNGVDDNFVERVKMLVARHEEGGNDDQNLLKDADSISFFENNVPVFLEKASEDGRGRAELKFDWMFNRITSEKAKEVARPWYENAIAALNK